MTMEAASDVHAVAARALDEIAAAPTLQALESVRAEYLGRGDGLITVERRRIGTVADPEAKKQLGQTINELVQRVEGALAERRDALSAAEEQAALRNEAMDLTWPPQPLQRGHLHPVTLMTRAIRHIFLQLGYELVEGPEVEYDRYNFTLLNMPPKHPSRDTQATFFVDDNRLLRTQTSPVQIRAMIQRGAPLKVIVPGKVFRRDNDPTHSPVFHQLEGLYIDEGVTVGDLKGTLEFFARSLFGAERAIRFRPHHFPFTEPSLELDISCMSCNGDGCRNCKGSGWLELLGSGMVHPQVLGNGGVDPTRYTGFAFGLGIERAAQLLYSIDDVRLLYENDVRFIRQGSQ